MTGSQKNSMDRTNVKKKNDVKKMAGQNDNSLLPAVGSAIQEGGEEMVKIRGLDEGFHDCLGRG